MNTMSTLMTDLGTVVTKALGIIPDVTGVIMDDPLLLMTTGFLFLGGCIGIIGRLLSRN